MAHPSRRSRSRTENKRHGHKQARQSTRHVLEDGGNPKTAHGIHWSSSVEQPPLNDEATLAPPRNKKKGCKRNKYGPHTIVAWPSESAYEAVWDEEKGWTYKRKPYWPRYHSPYRCEACGKGFYRIPKRHALLKSHPSSEVDPRTVKPSHSNYENLVRADHYDLYNIRSRLLGLPCYCKNCNPEYWEGS